MLEEEQNRERLRADIETRIASWGEFNTGTFNIPISALSPWSSQPNAEIWDLLSPLNDPAYLVVNLSAPGKATRLRKIWFFTKKETYRQPIVKSLELNLRPRTRPESTCLVYLLEMVEGNPAQLASFIRRLVIAEGQTEQDRRLVQREATSADLEFFYRALREAKPV